MYLLYLCKKKSQRSTIGDGSPLTVMYSLLRKYYPCTFCTCAKKKSAVNHRRWFSADCLSIPFSESTAHVPFVLVQNTSQRASTIGDGSPLTVNYSLLKCTTHVPFVLVQNTSQRSSTIDDGLCLRSLNYTRLRCTTHVPFVLVQNTSQRFLPLVSSQPSHLWLSALRRSPACLPPAVIGQALHQQ